MSHTDKELLQTANETAKAHYDAFQNAREKRKIYKTNTRLLGEAGKQYVAFRLAAMGVNPVILEPGELKGVDIRAKGNGENIVSIRVKTSAANNDSRQWDVTGNRPDSHELSFYIFVNLWDDYPVREIECFVIPSKFVEAHIDGSIRPQFKYLKKDKDKEVEFLNNWNLIGELLKL